jgi:hypothetical protein
MSAMLRDRYGWSIQPKIFISLVVLGLVLLAVAAALVIHRYAISGKEDRETISFGVTVIGAGVAIYGLMRAADNIRQSNAEKFRSASLNFVERWNSPGYWTVKAEWRKLSEELDPLTPKKRDEILAADIGKRIVAVEILNFYEEMATGINNSSLDGNLLRGYWEPVIINSFERYEYWIRQHRIRKSAPGYFDELEKLAAKWKSPRP